MNTLYVSLLKERKSQLEITLRKLVEIASEGSPGVVDDVIHSVLRELIDVCRKIERTADGDINPVMEYMPRGAMGHH